jgi:hypothetical protein
MRMKNPQPGLERLAARSMALLAFLAALAGCSNGLDPDKVTVTGGWVLETELGAVDFHFFMEEGPGGLISGTWSGPSRFTFHRISGRREGLSIDITGDSPNIFPMHLTATLVNKSRMDGHYYYGGQTEKIILRREVITPTLQ